MVCKVTPSEAPTSRGLPESQDQAEEVVDYETALDSAGYGRFSVSVLGACVGAFFATGVQNCVMSYVLPAARCDLGLTTYQAGLINMAFMCGGVASAFFWGIAGDVFGRRNILSMTLIVDAIILLAQSTFSDYRLLLAARSINGFLIGGPSTLVFTYLSDLVGHRKRQLYLNITGMSFVAAWLILPALAWLVIPLKSTHPTVLPTYSWRLYLALGSMPGLISGIWVMFLPESPRLLADTNRSDKALKILKRIHYSNCGAEFEYKIKKLISEKVFVGKSLNGDQNHTKQLFLEVLKDLKTLVSKSYAIKSGLILYVFFANMAAGFGLNMWIPELLQRMQGKECTSIADVPSTRRLFNAINSTLWKELTPTFDYRTSAIKLNGSIYDEYLGRREGEVCSGDIDEEVFSSGVWVGALCVFGAAVCAAAGGAGGAGVRRAAAGCAAACAAAAAALAACACACRPPSPPARVAAAAALTAASLNGNVLLIRLLLHALPPHLSGLGVCWGAWWGRAGGVASNLAVGALLDLSCPAPFVAVATLLTISIGAIMMIKLEDHLETGERDQETNRGKTVNLDRYISTHM